ncbi:bifunctional TH2 protein, mitochondrial-like [Hibiscus syriacus]|uniref:bifunctional TH2 protein, mitochondrial-like n=1 Tax=Hibiscus syriacus TaxID=106335 RepID=UPI0019249D37|nr:bifunctional TH2 protein, mitochondrial-like [Hibiscus syriacus]
MASSSKCTGPIIPNEDGPAFRCFKKFRSDVVLLLYSPYVICLASGTLNIDAFRHSISQDVAFLNAFARAYELAEDCADDDDEKLDISKLRKKILDALEMHDTIVEDWGLDSTKDCPVHPATLKYTEFVLETASGKVGQLKPFATFATKFEKTKLAAYILGTIAPCIRLHAFLAKEIKELQDSKENNHPYEKWIYNYSCEDFQKFVQQTEDLMDKLSVAFIGEELNINEKLYQQGLKLVIVFFHAQELTQPTVVPLTKALDPARDRLVLFSDFDLTCSVHDSSSILAEIAIVRAPKSDENQPEGQITGMLEAEMRKTWRAISREYSEEYERCIESILPPQKVEFNYETLHAALEKVSDFEQRENHKVVEAGLLKGLKLEDIKRAGERMMFQDGCISFFQKITKNENTDIHVLSYCWCSDLVRAAFSSGGLDVVNILANEFSFDESGSTGEIIGKIETPIDKVEAFCEILQGCSDDKRKLTVFIGDSVGDLLCLLKADIGIVIGTSISLRIVGTYYGVSFLPFFPSLVKKQKELGAEGSHCLWKRESGILYTVSTWEEIHALVLGN